MLKIPTKYSQLTESVSYEKIKRIIDFDNILNMHLGQLKLFFSELLFLALKAKPGFTVLYIGAAGGYHIGLLAKFFPELNFDLWDKSRFEVQPAANIKLTHKYFDNKEAQAYVGHGDNILFMCDIRNKEVAVYKSESDIEKIDDIVSDDMRMQKEWVQIIKPAWSYLKFRLPYHIKASNYLTGEIYLQPYAPLSTETRLLTNDYVTEITYDNIEFDNRMAYFNFRTRQEYVNNEWDKCLEENNLRKVWDTLFSLDVTYLYIKNIFGRESKAEACKLFLEVVAYHLVRFDHKFDILFTTDSTVDEILKSQIDRLSDNCGILVDEVLQKNADKAVNSRWFRTKPKDNFKAKSREKPKSTPKSTPKSIPKSIPKSTPKSKAKPTDDGYTKVTKRYSRNRKRQP